MGFFDSAEMEFTAQRQRLDGLSTYTARELVALTAAKDEALVRLADYSGRLADMERLVQALDARLKKLEAPPVVVTPPPAPPPVPVTPATPGTLVFEELWDKDLSQFIVEAPMTVGYAKIRSGALACYLSTEQPPNHANRWKSEVYPRDLAVTTWKKQKSEPLGVPMVYDFDLTLLPATSAENSPIGWTTAGGRILLAQVHGFEDQGESGRNPALALSIEMKSGRHCMVWRGSWSADAIQVGNPNTYDMWVGDPIVGKKLSVRIEALWSFTNTGRLKIVHTVDGVSSTIIDDVGKPNCFNDKYGPYFTFGLYHPTLSSAQYAYLVKRPRVFEAVYGPIRFYQV